MLYILLSCFNGFLKNEGINKTKFQSKASIFSQLTLTFLFILLLPFGAISQGTGKITGEIIDKENADALIGSNVFIKGIERGTATDLDGSFEILNVPAGNVEVVISYVGYTDQTINVSVKEGETTKLEIFMELTPITGEVVIVTAQARGQIAAINQQLASNKIINVVSGDKIRELPDANAAESI